jgi:hypothetical protein
MPSALRETEAIDKLETLLATLRTATMLAADVVRDPLLRRLISTFHAMPDRDRETIVGVVEREVQARLLSQATERVTGQGARANPNARLYVRTHQSEAQRSDFERDEMMLATLRALKVIPLLTIPEIHAEWRDATREALDQVEPETIAMMERLVVELLEIVRSARS